MMVCIDHPRCCKSRPSGCPRLTARLCANEIGIFFKLFVFALDNDGKVPAAERDLCVITGGSRGEVSDFISRFEGDLIEPGGPGDYIVNDAFEILALYAAFLAEMRSKGARGGKSAFARRSTDGLAIVQEGAQ